MQTIYQHLIKESKTELNSLLQEFTDIIDELKQPATKLELLKKNKDLLDDVYRRLDQYDARREPIKAKFRYLQEQESDISMVDLNVDDKAKLEGLDDAFLKFKEGLEDARSSIGRYYSQLRTEVDNSIEDFKKEC